MNRRDNHGQTRADIARDLTRLGDDQAAEHLDYNLGHALDGWADATRGTDQDHAGHLRWDTDNHGHHLSLTALQEARLTRLLSVDTGIHLAHSAATRQ